LFFLVGCSSKGQWAGLPAPAPVKEEAWTYGAAPGKVLTTPHYQLHTTITNPQVLQRLPQVMEGAYAQYRVFAGEVPASDKPMKCYVFGKREEWASFTQQHTGADAAVYLQISRGGYTVGDWFVSYYVGEDSTYS